MTKGPIFPRVVTAQGWAQGEGASQVTDPQSQSWPMRGHMCHPCYRREVEGARVLHKVSLGQGHALKPRHSFENLP